LQLRHQPATPRQRDNFFERTQPRLSFARNASRVPALSHG
jgi:hypothetical protein